MQKENVKIVNNKKREHLSSEHKLQSKELQTKKNVIDNSKETIKKVVKIVENAAKESINFTAEQLKQAKVIINDSMQSYVENNIKRNIEKYRPIFIENIPKAYPNMIHIVNSDIRMRINECKDAIGFIENIKGEDILGIYKKDYKKYKEIEFLPDRIPTESLYYVHPLNESQYINITEYFKHLHEQRIAELEYIAQELGAKYFEVEIIEEQTTKETSDKKADSKLKYNKSELDISVDQKNENKQHNLKKSYSKMALTGKEPREPKLYFWSNNVFINSLIKQRLSNDNPLKAKTYILDYNTSTGIKEKEGAKIDGVLQQLKFKVSASIQKTANEESKKKIAYTIEF